MVVRLYGMPIGAIDTLPDKFQRKFYLTPERISLAFGLLRQASVMDSEYPSEQINSLYFDTADLDQYARSLPATLRW